jgi:hypothetical protein
MRYYKTAALAAALAVPAMALAPVLASAATPSCGSTCVSGYAEEFGSQFVLDAFKQGSTVGTPVILFRESNSDPAEDWTYDAQGTVHTFVKAGLVSTAVGIHYGSDEAYELMYSPFGTPTGLCMGLGSIAANGTKVSLQPCGETARTVWIDDESDASGAYVPGINGSDLNFSDPWVLTYPDIGEPTSQPRPQLYTSTLGQFSGGTTIDNQEWDAVTGILP